MLTFLVWPLPPHSRSTCFSRMRPLAKEGCPIFDRAQGVQEPDRIGLASWFLVTECVIYKGVSLWRFRSIRRSTTLIPEPLLRARPTITSIALLHGLGPELVLIRRALGASSR